MKNLVPHYAFNEHGDLTKARMFETHAQVKKFLDTKYSTSCSFGIDNLTKYGKYREMAISYDFHKWMTKYLIHDSYGNFQAAWAPSVTALRRVLYLNDDDTVYKFPNRKA